LNFPSGTSFKPSSIGSLWGAHTFGRPAVEVSSNLVGSLPEETVGVLGTATGSSHILSPLVVTGKSGVRHSFTLGIKDTVSVVLACDIVVGPSPIDETKVLALFIKVYDVNARQVVLCGVPSFTREAMKLASQYKMVVLEAPEKDQVIAKLSNTLRELSTEK